MPSLLLYGIVRHAVIPELSPVPTFMWTIWARAHRDVAEFTQDGAEEHLRTCHRLCSPGNTIDRFQ